MIRTITRPSTANCTLPMYVGFLLSEPSAASCSRLSDVMNISHDSVNRFLNRESYTPQDLFNEVKESINLQGGCLSVDDSVLDKPYAKYIAYVSYFYSGKHHAVVKGINLITLYYTDPHGQHQPVNFRIYDKSENKTKNDYFSDMLAEVITWGLNPAFVTGDSWYSCVKNLHTIKNHHCGFLFGLESNRLVSPAKGAPYTQVQMLDIPKDGLIVWLREFGQIKLFRTHLKNQMRHYAIYLPTQNNTDDDNAGLNAFGRSAFEKLHDQHWEIEQYHRTIKQVCNIEHFQVRSETAVKNHIFSAICGYIKLQQMNAADVIKNCYRLQRDLFNEIIATFIKEFVPGLNHFNPQFHRAVNA